MILVCVLTAIIVHHTFCIHITYSTIALYCKYVVTQCVYCIFITYLVPVSLYRIDIIMYSTLMVVYTVYIHDKHIIVSETTRIYVCLCCLSLQLYVM